MKTKHIFSSAALIALSVFAVSCSNDDTTGTNNGFATFTGGSMPTVSESDSTANNSTRTSLFPQSGYSSKTINDGVNCFWEAGDCIYVQDDNSAWQKSANAVTSTSATFDFSLQNSYTSKQSYTVHYVGAGGDANKVTIKTAQTVKNGTSSYTTSNYVGDNGDCAVGTATKTADGKFQFKMKHKVSYLRFVLYSSALSRKYNLKEVKVTSNGTNIAGTYTLSDNGLNIGESLSSVITFNTLSPTFELLSSKDEINTTTDKNNRIYMVIAPGTHTLTVDYTLVRKDNTSDTQTVRKNYKAKDFKENTVYNIITDVQ